MNGKCAKALRESSRIHGHSPIRDYAYKIHERKYMAPILNDKGEITGEEEKVYKSIQVRLTAHSQRRFYKLLKKYYKSGGMKNATA